MTEQEQNPFLTSSAASGEAQTQQMPLPTIGEDDAPAAPSERRRSLDSAVVFLLVAVVAVGALYGMRRFGLGVELDFVEVEVDYKLDGVVSRSDEHTEILNQLALGVDDLQVPLENVQKNPFELLLGGAETAQTPGGEPGAGARREIEQRRVRVQQAFSALSLNSVLTGNVPVARISGETVRIGDSVGGAFVVRDINARTVELESVELPGRTYQLSLVGPGGG